MFRRFLTKISPAINGELRAYIISVEDDTLGVINVGDSINSITSTLDNKQDKITNNNYLEISDVSGLSEALENVTVNLDSSTDLTVGTINCGNLTGRTGTTITAPTITASSNLLHESTNTYVATKISSIETTLNGKQNTLASTTNITTGTISSGTITGKTGTTITAPNITASSNLLYGSTNVGTKISSIETSFNTKQTTLGSTTNITTGTISCGNITGRDTATFSAQTIKAGTNLLYGTTNDGTKIGE